MNVSFSGDGYACVDTDLPRRRRAWPSDPAPVTRPMPSRERLPGSGPTAEGTATPSPEIREKDGDGAGSIALAEQALARVASDVSEAYFRRADVIGLLLRQRQFDKAFALMEAQTPALKPQWALRDELVKADALLEVQDFSSAAAHFAAAQQRRLAPKMPPLSPTVQTVWDRVSASLGE